MNKKYDVAVIGGGASGLFSAVWLSKMGKRVLLSESNSFCGKKLLITGKGRCNVTNNCDVKTVMDNIPVNSKFMYSSLNGFKPEDTMDFFESLGVPLKTERGNRVFPVSDNARDIVDALVGELSNPLVDVVYKKTEKIIKNDEVFEITVGGETYESDFVIIATGGKSYPKTGSTGDGYKFGEKFGHRITEIKPSLVPIVAKEKYCADMMGLSLKNVTLTLLENGKPVFSELGEMLFTHFGVSGPLVLSSSAHIRDLKKYEYKFEIDLKPGLSEKQLDLRIQRDFQEMLNKDFINSLSKLLASKMIPVVVSLSGIAPDTKVNQITKEQRLKLLNVIKHFPVSVLRFRPVEDAIITSGGVDVKEINPKTMESKLVKGLYFTGEVLDVDAYTGGFNLQIAFSTAYAAAMDVAFK